MRKRGSAPFAATMLAAMLAILLVAGCSSGSQETQRASEDEQQKEEDLQQRIDELEEQKEEDLQEQIDDLKAQQEEQNQREEQNRQEPQVVIENSPPTAAPEGVVVAAPNVVSDTDLEESALNAAISYYQAVEVGDYAYTYNALSSLDQANYTYDEWASANNALDSAAAEFEVFRALIDSPNTATVGGGYPHVADVGVSVYAPDGSLSTRYTFFVYEGGVWKHWLTTEETDLFNSVL